jgi:Domain of unknown function (DUF4178)
MEFSCYQCNALTALNVSFEVENFVCPKCQSLYCRDNYGQYKFEKKLAFKWEEFELQVGQKAILKAIEYTITGIIIKKAHESFNWKEYVLLDQLGNFSYLSEADGHWIFLKEIENKYDISKHPDFLSHDDIEMDLYEYTDITIVSAQGFFDFEIPTGKVHMTEYINPPYILSFEKFKDKEHAFLGEHISKTEVKKAFKSSYMPAQFGTGLVQPFLIDVKNMAIIFCLIAISIFVSNWYIYKDRSEKNVLYKEFSFSEYSNKDFVSPSFTLEGGSAPLTISVNSQVDNSWASVQIALINETTNDEFYASKDIEYYHGYTDGESWSEGDNSEKFNICGVSEGKYHLVITPQKAPEDRLNNFLKVNVFWNSPSMINVWIPIVIMLIIVVIAFFLERDFERKRWLDSDDSTYEE